MLSKLGVSSKGKDVNVLILKLYEVFNDHISIGLQTLYCCDLRTMY